MLADDKTNEISSKRVIGFLGFLVLAFALIVTLYTPEEIEPSKELIAAVEFIVIGSLFGTTLDKFSKNGKP